MPIQRFLQGPDTEPDVHVPFRCHDLLVEGVGFEPT